MPKRVIIIGSGIIGASAAYHLARAGAEVSVLEAGEPGGVATRSSWAWINASWGNPEPYFRLRMRSIAEWHRLADGACPRLRVNWCGGLIWDLPPAELDAYAEERRGLGPSHPPREPRPRSCAIEPNLTAVPDHALHVAEEGMLEPLAAATALLDAARRWVRRSWPTHRSSGCEGEGRVTGVMTDDGVIHADETRDCRRGRRAPAARLGRHHLEARLRPPGLLAHSKPAGRLLNGLVMTPGLHLRQTAEGRIVAGTDFAGADPEGDAEGLAADLQAKVEALVEGGGGAWPRLSSPSATARRRRTAFPPSAARGERDGLYAIVTHSGVTLAPALGRFAAEEILTGVRDPLLAPYHPDRPTLT